MALPEGLGDREAADAAGRSYEAGEAPGARDGGAGRGPGKGCTVSGSRPGVVWQDFLDQDLAAVRLEY